MPCRTSTPKLNYMAIMKVPYLMCFIAVWLRVSECGPQLTLTPQPQTSGTYCPGPVTFTCVGTQIGGGLFWRVNGSTVAMYRFQDTIQYPFHLAVNPPLDSVTAVVTTVSINYNTFQINITSQLRAGDVTVLNGAALQCESILQSNVLRIEVGNTTTPPSPSSTSCSLLPSSGGAKVSLQWSPSFTSQHAVERYRVSVTPDPSSCSSDQVMTPSKDYSCSGLVLRTPYTFTLSAIKCGDQEGDTDTFTVQLEAPTTPTFITRIGEDVIKWNNVEAPVISERCGFDPLLNYTVVLEDNTGMILDQRVVSSDSCNDSCSIFFSPSSLAETCRVGVRANNAIEQSDTEYFLIDVIQLTTANQVLLATGVSVLCVAIVICIYLIVVIEIKTREGSSSSLVLRIVGGVLVVVSVVLWVAVALQVGLQQNTCDSTWQSTRNQLIIAAHVCSDVAFLVLVVGVLSWLCWCQECLCTDTSALMSKSCSAERSVYESPTVLSGREGTVSDSSVVNVNQNQVHRIGDGIEMKKNQVYACVGDGIEMKQNQVYGVSDGIVMKQNQVYRVSDGIVMKQNQVYGVGDGIEMKQV